MTKTQLDIVRIYLKEILERLGEATVDFPKNRTDRTEIIRKIIVVKEAMFVVDDLIKEVEDE